MTDVNGFTYQYAIATPQGELYRRVATGGGFIAYLGHVDSEPESTVPVWDSHAEAEKELKRLRCNRTKGIHAMGGAS